MNFIIGVTYVGTTVSDPIVVAAVAFKHSQGPITVNWFNGSSLPSVSVQEHEKFKDDSVVIYLLNEAIQKCATNYSLSTLDEAAVKEKGLEKTLIDTATVDIKRLSERLHMQYSNISNLTIYHNNIVSLETQCKSVTIQAVSNKEKFPWQLHAATIIGKINQLKIRRNFINIGATQLSSEPNEIEANA